MTDKEYPPVKFLRLKNGDDVVTEMVEIGENDIVIYMLINPFKVVYAPTAQKGYVQIAFMPWVFSRICEKQEFMIKSEDVMMITDVSEYMQKYYWETIEGPEESDIEEESEEESLENLKEILEKLGLNNKRTMH